MRWMTWLVVALGGAVGSLARHLANIATHRVAGQSVPYATFAVNILGSWTIGVLAGLVATERLHIAPTTRTLVFVGVLGGFTTFSSFMLDTLTLAQEGQLRAAFLNAAGQVALGYLAAYVGFRLAHWTW